MENRMDEWHKKERVEGKYHDIFNGDVCKTIPGPDRLPFFCHDLKDMPDGELQLGVTIGADWSVIYSWWDFELLMLGARFSYLRSQRSASHTSGPISYSLINLPAFLRCVDLSNTKTHQCCANLIDRYWTANLFPSGILPGPKGPTGDKTQWFMWIIINELLHLWKEGIIVCTPKYPLGWLIRIILVALVCDKPVAHKLGGFSSHSHRFFCTQCWIEQQYKVTPATFAKDGELCPSYI